MDGVINVWTDGGCRSNPGDGAWAFVVRGESFEHKASGFLRDTTNNEAEYRAMFEALTWLRNTSIETDVVGMHRNIVIHSDSQLMVKQLNDEYAVKAPSLKPLFESAYYLLWSLKRNREVEIVHVRREQNKEADALCNEVQDKHGVVCVRRKSPVVASQ